MFTIKGHIYWHEINSVLSFVIRRVFSESFEMKDFNFWFVNDVFLTNKIQFSSFLQYYIRCTFLIVSSDFYEQKILTESFCLQLWRIVFLNLLLVNMELGILKRG